MDRRTLLATGMAAFSAGRAWAAAPQGPDDMAGNWDTSIDGPDRSLQFIVAIEGRGAGERKASLWSTEQGPSPLPGTARQTGRKVVVSAILPPVRIEGELSADGATIAARYWPSPDAAPLPMTLRRRAAGAPKPGFPGVEEGEFLVPEDRALPGSRQIALRYLRLRSKAARPGSPLFVLAGGPGTPMIDAALSGRGDLAMWRYFDRDRDVILLDQRGCGRSDHFVRFAPSPPRDFSYQRPWLLDFYRKEAARLWKVQTDGGVAMTGYTTVQNAHDIDGLRKHLGYEKVCLHGASYGTHLAQAVLKYHPDIVERVVLEGLEGLDQTVKRPAAVDAVLARLAGKIAADPTARDAYPDLVGLIRRVHASLDANPVKLPSPAGAATADSFAAKMMIASLIGSPAGHAILPWIYREAERAGIAAAYRALPPGAGGLPAIAPMNLAMDTASGISAARLAQVTEETGTALVGDALNFPHPNLRDVIPLDLGEDFRKPIRTDVPALLFAGDLDGRTPLEEAREVATQFTRASFITVENGGHGGGGPDIQRLKVKFLKGEAPAIAKLTQPPIRFRV